MQFPQTSGTFVVTQSLQQRASCQEHTQQNRVVFRPVCDIDQPYIRGTAGPFSVYPSPFPSDVCLVSCPFMNNDRFSRRRLFFFSIFLFFLPLFSLNTKLNLCCYAAGFSRQFIFNFQTVVCLGKELTPMQL